MKNVAMVTVLFLALAGLSSFALGATTWTSTLASDWFTAGNWNNGVPNVSDGPTVNDDAIIANAGTAQITAPGAEANLLTISSTTSGGVSISGATSTLRTLGTTIVGNASGTALFTQTNGTVTLGGTLIVADAASSGGHLYDFTGGVLRFGTMSGVTFTQGTTQDLRIDQQGTFNHKANVTTLIPQDLTVGFEGAGQSVFAIYDGVVQVGRNIAMGTGGTGGADTLQFGDGTPSGIAAAIAAGAQLQLTGAASNFRMIGNAAYTNPTGHDLYIPGTLTVGDTAALSSVFTHNGGIVTVGTVMIIGDGSATGGHAYNFNAGTLRFGTVSGVTFTQGTTQDLRIDQDGKFNHYADVTTFVPRDLIVGNEGAGQALFSLYDGVVQVGRNFQIGTGGTGAADTFQFGDGTPSGIAAAIAAGAQLQLTGAASNFRMIGNAAYTNPTGHDLYIPGTLTVGETAGLASVFTENGGTVTVGTLLVVGDASASGGHTFNHNGGILRFGTMSGMTFTQGTTQDLRIDQAGTFNHNAASTTLISRDLIVGNEGAGTAVFNLNAGTVQVGRDVLIGVAGNVGNFTVASGATLQLVGVSSDLTMRNNTTFTTSGTVIVADQLTVGSAVGTGTFTQNAGLVQTGGNLFVSTIASNTGIYNQNGGTTIVGNGLQLGTVLGSNGTYNLSGGSLKVLGTLKLNANPGTDAFNFTGGKLSAGTLQLGDGLFTYTGGLLSPGLLNTPATMTVNGSLLMPAAGGLEFDLAQPNVFGGLNDLLDVNGLLTLDGTLNINAPNGLPTGLYPLITFDSLVNNGLETNNPFYTILIQFNGAGPSGTVYLATVPEPSSALLLGIGTLGLALRRKKYAVCLA